uniref:Uncharacterized protein n=1 Tax=Anguilla anguilla TaxID=7936 RepID=A0A0E9UW21_ANGAN
MASAQLHRKLRTSSRLKVSWPQITAFGGLLTSFSCLGNLNKTLLKCVCVHVCFTFCPNINETNDVKKNE